LVLVNNRAAALATGCTVKAEDPDITRDLRQNKALGACSTFLKSGFTKTKHAGDEVANVVRSRYGSIDYEWGISGASTDFVGSPALLQSDGFYLLLKTLVTDARKSFLLGRYHIRLVGDRASCSRVTDKCACLTWTAIPSLHPGFGERVFGLNDRTETENRQSDPNCSQWGEPYYCIY